MGHLLLRTYRTKIFIRSGQNIICCNNVSVKGSYVDCYALCKWSLYQYCLCILKLMFKQKLSTLFCISVEEKHFKRKILPFGNPPSSTVEVYPNELHVSIDHFSWRIVSFIRTLITHRITLCYYPLLPTCMPKGRKVKLHIHIYKDQKAMREVCNCFDNACYSI